MSDKTATRAEIDAAIRAASPEFDLDRAMKTLGRSDALRRRFENAIDADEEFFRDREWHCMRRSAFFRGMSFLITPDRWEIENGFLVPGHRFHPFLSPAVFPSDAELRPAEAKSAPVPRRTVTAPLGEIFHYHTLLGSEEIFDHFCADDPANRRLAEHHGSHEPVTLTVFDLAEFFRSTEFSPGDALLCRVADYDGGTVEFSFLSASERSSRKRSGFVAAFDRALGETIALFGPMLDIPEQLARACYLGRGELDFAAASFEEYLHQSLRVGIRADSDFAVLTLRGAEEEQDTDDDGGAAHDGECGCGHDHHEGTELPEGLSLLPADASNDPLEILRELGSPLSAAEIDGFILDALAAREPDFDAFRARAFPHVELDAGDEVRQVIARNFLEERFEELCETFDRVGDELKAPLRAAIMECVEDRVELLDTMALWEEDRRSAAKPKLESLAAVALQLEEALKLLNNPAFTPDEGETERLRELVDDRSEEQETIIESLTNEEC